MPKILLNNKRSKSSANKKNIINAELERSGRILPFEGITSRIDEYKQYLKEKEASKKYRLTFTINPICSNILFNNISEIIYKEGSDECVVYGKDGVSGDHVSNINDYLVYKEKIKPNNNTYCLTRQELIRDTGFTHPEIGPLVYHCGYDIFNNHTLRKKEFNVINKINTTANVGKCGGFNTISDYRRDSGGRIIEETLGRPTNGTDVASVKVEMHQYHLSNILTFSEAINENLVEENGWIGFINKATLNIPNYEWREGNNKHEVSLNKTMNNNKHGEFIDMYPDRSLFSFIPKVNKYRNNRLEPNWDYCLTYPCENIYDNELVQYTYKDVNDNDVVINGLSCKLLLHYKYDNIFDMIDGTKEDENGAEYDVDEDISFTLRTKFKNNFKKDSKVQFIIIGKKRNDKGDYYITHEIIDEPITIEDVNEDDNSFTVNGEELKDALYHFVDDNDDGDDVVNYLDIRVRQIKNGVPCEYYFRKFKKLLKSGNDNFNSLINKMGFSKTIYSDDVSQILFNDDVDVTGLRDNLDRELSEIYLTIVKNNTGNESWYDDRNYKDVNITYSHCFGKITSGIDIKDVDEYDYNIHKIHNVPPIVITNTDYNVIKKRGGAFSFLEDIFKDDKSLPLTLEDDMTINKEEFLGDIVEFSPSQVHETTLEYVKHRFNTRQREYFKVDGSDNVDKEFYDMLIDEIYHDDYDITMYGKGNNDVNLKFKLMDGGYKCSLEKNNGDEDVIVVDKNSLEPNKFNAIYDVVKITDGDNKEKEVRRELVSLPANIAPEGYYYQPHYRIPLKEYRNNVLQGKHEEIFIVDGTESIITNEDKINDETVIKANTNVFSYLERLGANRDGLYLYDSYNGNKKVEAIITAVGKFPSTEFTMKINKPINDVLSKITFDIEIDGVVNEALYLPMPNSNKKVLIGKSFEQYRVGDIVNDKGEIVDNISSNRGASVKNGDEVKQRYTLLNKMLIEHGASGDKYDTILSNRYRIYKPVLEMPNNSIELKDGTGRFLWREFKQEHEYESEKGEINDYVFTNGCHYINKGINFFLRRQDPDGRYNLSNVNVGLPFINNLAIDGYSTDTSNAGYFEIDEEVAIC